MIYFKFTLNGDNRNEYQSGDAVLKIFQVKNRPAFNPLIAHTDSVGKVEKLVKEIPPKAHKLIVKFWPGPLTVLLEKQPDVPDVLTSGHSRVAARIPDHPLTLSLLSQLDFPLAAPSANPFGYVSPTTAGHVNDQLGDKVPFILDGGSCKVGLESTIIGFEEKRVVVYRLGGISLEDLEREVGKVVVKRSNNAGPSAPGMLKSHYSPGRRILIGAIAKNIADKDTSAIGVISYRTEFPVPKENQFVLSPSGDINEAAGNIFTALRKMDQPHIREVFAEWLPDKGLGRAINDRLKRASVYKRTSWSH